MLNKYTNVAISMLYLCFIHASIMLQLCFNYASIMLQLCFNYVIIMHIPRHCRTNQPRLIVSQSSKATLFLLGLPVL
jgi:hypothetical protein